MCVLYVCMFCVCVYVFVYVNLPALFGGVVSAMSVIQVNDSVQDVLST